MGFVFQKSYTESLSKKWYVASTLPIYTHSQAPHREQHMPICKKQTRKVLVCILRRVLVGVMTPPVQSEYMMCVLCQL